MIAPDERILVKEQDLSSVTASGIQLRAAVKDNITGTIVAAGKLIEDLSVGDTVSFPKGYGTKVDGLYSVIYNPDKILLHESVADILENTGQAT